MPATQKHQLHDDSNERRLLIVDDDRDFAESLLEILEPRGYKLAAASGVQSALQTIEEFDAQVALLDLKLPDGSGTRLLSELKQLNPDCACILVTAYADVDSAVAALEKGAFYYLRKPFKPEELLQVLDRAFEMNRLRDEKRRTDEALQASEAKYRTVLEASPDPVMVCDTQGNVVYLNPSFTRVFGWTLEERLGRAMDIFVPEESRSETRKKTDGLLAGKNYTDFQTHRMTKDGKEIPVSISAATHRDSSDAPIGIVFNLRDIRRQKKLEDQLIQAQKMKAVGTLAGGLAHDFNNLLMGIMGNVSLMLWKMDPDHAQYDGLKRLEGYVERGADLTKQLLGFAREGKYEIQPMDINVLVERSTELFGSTKKEIKIHTEYQKGLWTVEVDKNQIEQVLLNLYVNASQAMPEGGSLFIQTDNVYLEDEFVRPHDIGPGRYIKISVTDTGVGMDQETQKRVFDPFFTTSAVGKGTGLGLASAYGIVKNHGGIINVYSKIAQGATINIYLPASGKEAVKENESVDGVVKGSETILLVDDEAMVIDVAVRLLETMGYRALAARNGKEALEIFRENRETIDLVILDMIMPEMGGRETYGELKKIRSEIKVLLSSGYSLNDQAREIMAQGCNAFIQKPFNMEELSKKIRQILDSL